MPVTYESIATTTLSSATGTVTFSNIPATYTDLVAVLNFGVSVDTANIYYRLNNDSGTNYSNTSLYGNGTSAISTRSSNAAQVFPDAGGAQTSRNTVLILHFMNYSNTTTNKTVLSRFNTAAYAVQTGVGLWRSTAAINRIDFTINGYNFISGSTLTLYGIKAA